MSLLSVMSCSDAAWLSSKIFVMQLRSFGVRGLTRDMQETPTAHRVEGTKLTSRSSTPIPLPATGMGDLLGNIKDEAPIPCGRFR